MAGRVAVFLFAITLAAPPSVRAQEASWDSVGRILGAPDVYAAGYHRYNLPRRDLTLRVGDVTVAPALALGAWAGFSGMPEDATTMGDLVVTSSEVSPVLAQLARGRIEVTAVHNHLVGEQPQLTYIHFHGQGNAVALARRLDRVIALTSTPRPVQPAPTQPLTIDTAAVFTALGHSGKAQGAVAQLSFVLVPDTVTLNGRPVTPALGYGSPINVQMLDASHAVATGDFAVRGPKVGALLTALAEHGITATAVHSHLIDESPRLYYIHFWANGPYADVLRGLRAAVDAVR
ncbi:MAG TPA: DUF1259 domain-containing protein [Gemmatimonadales bacterium]|nr:DUF1259 domain-containing protein [Gemmatimonadales bacterium]